MFVAVKRFATGKYRNKVTCSGDLQGKLAANINMYSNCIDY